MNIFAPSRRATLAGLAASAAFAVAPQRTVAAAPTAAALLDRLAWQLLELQPAEATRLGVDTGHHAALRSRLDDRSPAGVEKSQAFLSQSLVALGRVSRAGLDPATLTSLAVAESAFRTALDGMKLPYGVATIGNWRNTPYTVIQNVGAWLDVPQLLDGDQPVRDAADCAAYLARLSATAAQLDGETLRGRIARGQGLVPPAFLLDKTIVGVTRTVIAAYARIVWAGSLFCLIFSLRTPVADRRRPVTAGSANSSRAVHSSRHAAWPPAPRCRWPTTR